MSRTKTKQNSDKIDCLRCGKPKALTNYYLNTNPLLTSDKFEVCKDCINVYIGDKDSKGYLDRVNLVLALLNKPFNNELWIKRGEDWAKYIPQVSTLHQYKDLYYSDSDFHSFMNNHSYNSISRIDSEVHPIHDEKDGLISFWGRGLEDLDYEYLNNFYSDYSNTYATDTPVQVNLYKNIAKVHLQAEKELSGGKIKAFKDLMELSSKLHNDGNIKPIQSTGANDDKGLSTYGLWIKEIEKEEPCEYFEKKPIYEDHDKFKKYIDQWFIRPFKNIFNLSKDFDIDQEDE